MKFERLNDNRMEATKGAKGVCPCCGNDLGAKCGEVYIHHWAHKKKCDDYWWENETEWHRNWKNKFPIEWQEVIHKDESGEKHIADVKTDIHLFIYLFIYLFVNIIIKFETLKAFIIFL
mgnify:CR=1 FL=1